MTGRRWYVAAVVMAVALSACGQRDGTAAPADGQQGDTAGGDAPPVESPLVKAEVVICATDEPDSLLALDESHYLWQLVGMPAVRSDGAFGVEALALAELPTVGNGGLVGNADGSLAVILRYRGDLTWSDGENFSVDDALLGIQAAQAAEVVNVQKVDDHTLAVTLAEGAGYPYVPGGPPLPAHALGGMAVGEIGGSEYGQSANPALGPYVVEEWARGDAIRLAANPNYAGDKPAFSEVVVRFVADSTTLLADLRAGRCDVSADGELAASQLAELLQDGQISVASGPNLLWEHIDFNTAPGNGRVPYFADARVRQAVALAVNRQALADEFGAGLTSPLDSWLPPEHWAYPADDSGLTRYVYDPARAQELLVEAGWVDGNGDGIREYSGGGGEFSCRRGVWSIENGEPLRVTLLTNSGEEERAIIASQMQADLAAVGMRVEVQTLDTETMFGAQGPLVRREFDMALFALPSFREPYGVNWWLGADLYRHPLTGGVSHDWQVEERFDRPTIELLAGNNIPSVRNNFGGQNISGWCDEAANFAIYEATSALSLAERKAAYARQQVIFSQQLPSLPLFQRLKVLASSPQICGVRSGPLAAVTWNVAEWYFDPDGAV